MTIARPTISIICTVENGIIIIIIIYLSTFAVLHWFKLIVL